MPGFDYYNGKGSSSKVGFRRLWFIYAVLFRNDPDIAK
jgi:hypothetical protein